MGFGWVLIHLVITPQVEPRTPEMRISYLYGIVVSMYSNDHLPPHFHARYGEYEANIDVATGEPQAGDLPVRALRIIREWASCIGLSFWPTGSQTAHERARSPQHLRDVRGVLSANGGKGQKDSRERNNMDRSAARKGGVHSSS
jgi:hypothetical protein